MEEINYKLLMIGSVYHHEIYTDNNGDLMITIIQQEAEWQWLPTILIRMGTLVEELRKEEEIGVDYSASKENPIPFELFQLTNKKSLDNALSKAKNLSNITNMMNRIHKLDYYISLVDKYKIKAPFTIYSMLKIPLYP